jgi:hypothetical protein
VYFEKRGFFVIPVRCLWENMTKHNKITLEAWKSFHNGLKPNFFLVMCNDVIADGSFLWRIRKFFL